MTDAREAVLGRVRAALAARSPAAETPRLVPGALASHETPEKITTFVRELAGLGGVAHGPLQSQEVATATLQILREIHAHELIAWNDADLPVPGLREALGNSGFQLLDARLPEERAQRRERLARLAEADASVTGALAGLADTGSLVLTSGPGRPRLSWLLPPVHIALLRVSALYASLPEFLMQARNAAAASAHLALVTGPSSTADIELILTRGVQGPAAMHVVLLL